MVEEREYPKPPDRMPLWTEEQAKVICARPGARILVDAGPGTGKTAVACARIAWLIDREGLSPGEVWLVSFTRTAVHELRNRIGAFLPDRTLASSVRITTIDSCAWSINSGFDEKAVLSDGYQGNIEKTIGMIRSHEGVHEFLSRTRHLLIDEAQDVVGQRVELMLEFISAIEKEAGVTILSDEAQAIYGFTEKDQERERNENIRGTLPDNVRRYMGDSFLELELKEIHRTGQETLRSLFSEGRMLLRDGDLQGRERYDRVRGLIKTRNHGTLGTLNEDLSKLSGIKDNSFLLFRRRGETLEASSRLGLHPHRIRMSGLPGRIPDWIGRIFWDWTERDMARDAFFGRWAERVAEKGDPLSEWRTLVRLVGKTQTIIDVPRLSGLLSRGMPPPELSLPDFGPGGPLIGTIHGAKGREAGQVRLYLPQAGNSVSTDWGEEARVLFVGASRARDQLLVGDLPYRFFPPGLKPRGRVYSTQRRRGSVTIFVEIGLSGDIDALGLVGRKLFKSTETAKACQNRLSGLGQSIVFMKGRVTDGETDRRYEVRLKECADITRLFFLSPQVNEDLLVLCRKVLGKSSCGYRNLPKVVPDLRLFGVTTLALSPEDSAREDLLPPWKDSGFMIAPLILGYGRIFLGR